MERARKIAAQGMMPILYLFDHPFKEPPIPGVTEEDCRRAEADTALFVLARNSGEGKDRRPVAGEYGLFSEEEEAIRTLRANFRRVILILNVGSVIETGFLCGEASADAILLMSQAGNIGGHALTDVLTGKVTPGGKLTTTWAKRYEDYPGASAFSHMNGDVDDEYYEEGIYVGYRYFDSFNITPAYPFGFGLSYTTFRTETEKVEADEERVSLQVKVTNTGNRYPGKEVVQVYCSAPSGKLEKPYRELAAYKVPCPITSGELQACAGRILKVIAGSSAYEEAGAHQS